MNHAVKPNDYSAYPDAVGRFGDYGGRYVAETLMPLVLELDRAYAAAKADPAFQAELSGYLTDYVGRPSPLYFAARLTDYLGGAKIYFKREELTEMHKGLCDVYFIYFICIKQTSHKNYKARICKKVNKTKGP